MLRRALVAAALTLVALPATASAATVSKLDATTLRYVATPGITDALQLKLTDSNAKIMFDRASAPEGTASVGCDAPSAGDVKCDRAGITRVVVVLGDGNDLLNVNSSVEFPIALDVDGGTGDEVIFGGTAADVLRGGPGGDQIFGLGGADDITGGGGFDGVRFTGTAGVAVSLDDVANDGTGGGAEGANAHSDIEDVRGTQGNDVLIGSAAANVLDGSGGDDRVDGRGGLDFYDLGAGADVALARDGLGERIMCGDGADRLTGDDIDESSACEVVELSGALVRDLDGDGIAKPEDCDDADPAVRPGARDTPDDGADQDCDGADASDPDRDRDGAPRPFDCDDANPASTPGKPEVFGNQVDEDCNGRADPLQSITTPVRARFIAGPRAARIARLQVVGAAPGTTVEVRCKGRGCGFKRRTVADAGRKLDLRKRLRLRRLGRQTLEVRLLRADSIGRVVRFSGKGGGLPETRVLCLPPGAPGPGPC